MKKNGPSPVHVNKIEHQVSESEGDHGDELFQGHTGPRTREVPAGIIAMLLIFLLLCGCPGIEPEELLPQAVSPFPMTISVSPAVSANTTETPSARHPSLAGIRYFTIGPDFVAPGKHYAFTRMDSAWTFGRPVNFFEESYLSLHGGGSGMRS